VAGVRDLIADSQRWHRDAAHTEPMTDPVEPPVEPQAQPPVEPPVEPAPASEKTTWRDRVLGMRGVVAVALASLVVGGLGGLTLSRVVDDGHDEWRGGWHNGGPHGPMMGHQNGAPNQ
jgi:hypothetical protein